MDTMKSGNAQPRKNARKHHETVDVFELAFTNKLPEHLTEYESVTRTIERHDAIDPSRLTICTKITDVLAGCGLSSYIDVFLKNGYDDLETLFNIRERDLEILNIKIGH